MGTVDPISQLFWAIEKHNRPFKWGVSDCCLFAADVIRELTGTDYASAFRGYDSRNGAVQALRSAGFSSLKDAITSVLGEPKAPELAMRGDVVLIQNMNRHIAGICVDQRAACQGRDGVVYLDGFVCAWGVL